MQCIFLCADLMFASRVLSAAKGMALPLKIVPVAADLPPSLTEECRLLIVDLTMPNLDLGQVVSATQKRAPSARIVAFGPHVDEVALSAARAAGCEVLTRGQFHQGYTALLEEAKQ